MKEIWKDVPGYEGLYEVSNLGNVKGLNRTVNHPYSGHITLKERILKLGIGSCGYKIAVLCNGNKKTFNAASLVAMAFLGHKPDRYKIVVDHVNAVRTDDRLENLQLITQRENASKDRKGNSKYTGVCWHSRDKIWQTNIRINGKLKYLGRFKTELEASKAYQNELAYLKK